MAVAAFLLFFRLFLQKRPGDGGTCAWDGMGAKDADAALRRGCDAEEAHAMVL